MELFHLLEDTETDFESSDSENEYEDEINIFIYLYLMRKSDTTRHSIVDFIENIVPDCTEQEFISQFRIGSNVCEQLIQKFEQCDIYKNLFSTTGGRPPISPEKHILTFLYFIGHEAVAYRAVNNIFNITISALYSVLNRVSDFICSLGCQFIKWPNHDEIIETKSFFRNFKGIPNVVGIIDGCHMKIDKPINDPDSYLNKNKDYSIQMQGIINQERKFIDIFIGYPGSVHDARVLKNSSIFNTLPDICQGGYILGDNEYPTLEYLMVPYRNNGHLTEIEKNYNSIHSSARVSIQETFSLLKQRFPLLHHLKLKNPRLIVQIIKACCILHNISNPEDFTLLQEPDISDITEEDEEIEDTETGKQKRNNLAHYLWNTSFIQTE